MESRAEQPRILDKVFSFFGFLGFHVFFRFYVLKPDTK